MRVPKSPPDEDKVLQQAYEKHDRGILDQIFGLKIVDDEGVYLHWEKMRFSQPPEGLNRREWWAGTRFARRRAAKTTSLEDKNGKHFTFCMTEQMEGLLHWIDVNVAGMFTGSFDRQTDETSLRDVDIIRSLSLEAYSSSRLEGASSSRHVAQEMIRQRRQPVDKSERMIVNNYNAMQFIRQHKSAELTKDLIFELHGILTDKTLDERDTGRLRAATDDVFARGREGGMLHVPPTADQLDDRFEKLIRYAAGEDEQGFTHPVIKAILIHFMFSYEQLFVDGNGRTARIFFYWLMARQNYWLTEYISISTAIKEATSSYRSAFLMTVLDQSDLTYFIIHQLEVIQQAVGAFKLNLENQSGEMKQARSFVDATEQFREKLNLRQLGIVRHALRHPATVYTIDEHRNAHGVTYETARRDLMTLHELGLFRKSKTGRKHTFLVPENILEVLHISDDESKAQDEDETIPTVREIVLEGPVDYRD